MPATTLTDRAVIRVSGEDVRGFLQTAFSRVSSSSAGEILARVPWGKKLVRPRQLGENRVMAEELHKALGEHTFSRLLQLKREEFEDYRIQVTPYEIEKFLPVL